MAGQDDDEEYSDDDLDAIAGDEFLHLQQQAFQATQRAQTVASSAHRPKYHEANAAVVTRPISASTSLDPNSLHNLSSDYGEFEEEVVDAEDVAAPGGQAQVAGRGIRDEVSQREHWRRNRFAEPIHGQHRQPKNRTQASTILPHRGPTPTGSGWENNGNRQPQHTDLANDFKANNDELSLDARIQQLLEEKRSWESEREVLLQGVKAAQDEVLGKSGEISIIRSNHARQEKERERMIADLKRQQTEAEDRHKQALEHAKKEKESLVTHNRFLDHENDDNAWQNVASRKTGKLKANGPTSLTPRRQRTKDVGDGFNDDEITMSPSKSMPRSKGATPKQGAKRKRDLMIDSPGQSLHLADEAGSFLQDAAVALKTDDANAPESSHVVDSRFDFLQSLLAHRVEPGMKRTFEVFATLNFPSNPNVAVSTLLLDKMGTNDVQRDKQDFPSTIGAIVLSIWEKCLDENYYTPVYYLCDLVKFILLNGNLATVNHLVCDIATIAQLTADVNVIPRFQTLTRNTRSTIVSGEIPEKANDEIYVKECLELLTLTATLCAGNSALAKTLWRLIRFDFISMLLRAPQHVDDIIMTVKFLEPCVQHDQLGFICNPNATAGLTSEQHIIDRLTSMLIEVPRPLTGSDPYNPLDIVLMRLEILQLLEQLCDNKMSGDSFANHPQALGRVVRAMNDQLTTIYISLAGRELRSEVVNHACRIVFHVTTAYSGIINLQEKLRSQPGGVNKYLIALSRLAFSDTIHYERDIDEDVVDCAHQMLEDFVSPEEADALRAAFVKDDR